MSMTSEPANRPASHRRRLALLLGIPIVVLLIAIGVWAFQPKSLPSTAAANTGSPTSPTATATVVEDLLPSWEQTLGNLDIPGDCFEEKPSPLTPECMREAENVGAAAREIAKQADQLGSRYTQVQAVAHEASQDADTWAGCPQTDANTQERRDCLASLWDLRTASEAILAEIYAVEHP